MKRKILDFMLTACCMAFSFLGLVACDNELDIRQEYPFTVETMPVAQSGKESQTIDLYLEDNWGNLQQLTYDFNGKDTDEENNKEAA